MNLNPREKDKLMIAVAAQVARGRLARGVKEHSHLPRPETQHVGANRDEKDHLDDVGVILTFA